MSRVGKKPIPLPSGVKINIGDQLQVEGPKGKLTVPIPAGIRVEQNNGTLNIVRENDSYAAAHGLTRAWPPTPSPVSARPGSANSTSSALATASR